MAIRIIKQSDIYLTPSELRRYQDEYNRTYSMYAGEPPTLEDFIRSKKAYEDILRNEFSEN